MEETNDARQLLQQLPLEHLFTYKSELVAHVFDAGFGNTRMFTQVSSGSFEGPDLCGHIAVGPSSESAIIRSDGVLIGEVNLLLVTDDDAEILMRYTATAIPNERAIPCAITRSLKQPTKNTSGSTWCRRFPCTRS